MKNKRTDGIEKEIIEKCLVIQENHVDRGQLYNEVYSYRQNLFF
jgi:hypothetical protein